MRSVCVIAAAGVLLASCGGSRSSALHTGAATTAPATSAPAATTVTTVTAASAGTGTVGPGSTIVVPPVGPTSSTTAPPRTTVPPTTGTTTAPAPPAGSGAYGLVTAGPTCPVERPGQPCPPAPVTAEVSARNSSGATVASTRSDSQGRYTLPLPPGSYTLDASTGNTYPRCTPVTVTVTAGSATRADISCDTGIR